MHNFLTVLKMDLQNLFKNPVLVGYNTVFSVLLILIMGYLCGGIYADSKDAYQYYTVSLLVYGMLNGAMTASNCFMERDIKRPNLRIIYSPGGSFQIYFSKILSSFLFNYSLHLLLLLVVCPLFQVSLGSNPVFFLLLMAPVEFTSVSLGAFFCCIFHCEETTSSLLSTLISLLCFLGGSFFSLDGMGSTLAFITKLSPVKWLNEAFFTISCDNSLEFFWPVFLGAALLSLLLILGCRLFFRTEDYI
ncbi:ABC transporter permease [Anaerocolumna sp. AGMB13020]|uniref:ABC transporter permease n=1 Tax=Anaerocolumna sp. AGMB13020 TaxID=3081750 RepID=UPI002955DDFC|nr:ABC transporter permease [Anaerocolumna sp. AGMB13020]WOO37914.1 ABC transporter permease [Anaerocolumna sp. AGMB13020]